MIHFTATDGTRIAFSDMGEGPPLLCLAGLTRNSSDFDYVAPHLEGTRLICMDYRGRGASAWSGADTYTIPREALDVLELLDHLHLTSVPILGTSRGGLVGLVLAATAADRVAGLAMNDIGPVIERAGLDGIKDYVGRNPASKTHGEAAKLLSQRLPGFANVPLSRWQAEAKKHYVETFEGLRINYDPALRDSFMAAYEAPEQPDLWPLFDALASKPVALIRGENSDLCSYETAREMARRRPDMFWAEVPDRGHVPFLDEPESLTALRAFLKACAS